jgi:branched-chain amino acid transport system substrate-binding protein
MEQVLRQCSDDLTRKNILKQASKLRDMQIGALLPGSLIATSSSAFRVVEHLVMQGFDGRVWQLVK